MLAAFKLVACGNLSTYRTRRTGAPMPVVGRMLARRARDRQTPRREGRYVGPNVSARAA